MAKFVKLDPAAAVALPELTGVSATDTEEVAPGGCTFIVVQGRVYRKNSTRPSYKGGLVLF